MFLVRFRESELHQNFILSQKLLLQTKLYSKQQKEKSQKSYQDPFHSFIVFTVQQFILTVHESDQDHKGDKEHYSKNDLTLGKHRIF